MNEKKDSLYLECYSGISGDMVTAALLDLGADEVVLRKALASLPLDGFSINISRVKKAGLDACDFDVVQRFGSLLAERAAQRPGLPLRILGPAPMNITMLNGKFRYKLTLKCRNDTAFRTLLRETLDAYAKEKMPQKASVIVDFNSDGDL